MLCILGWLISLILLNALCLKYDRLYSHFSYGLATGGTYARTIAAAKGRVMQHCVEGVLLRFVFFPLFGGD